MRQITEADGGFHLTTPNFLYCSASPSRQVCQGSGVPPKTIQSNTRLAFLGVTEWIFYFHAFFALPVSVKLRLT
jgi:hypothetical protein